MPPSFPTRRVADRTTGHLTPAVKFHRTAPQLRPELDMGHVAHVDRGAALADPDRYHLNILDAADIATPTHHVFGLGHFHQPPADIVVGALEDRKSTRLNSSH